LSSTAISVAYTKFGLTHSRLNLAMDLIVNKVGSVFCW